MYWKNICLTALCLSPRGCAPTLFPAGTSPEARTGAVGTRRCAAPGSAPGAALSLRSLSQGSGSRLPCAWDARGAGARRGSRLSPRSAVPHSQPVKSRPAQSLLGFFRCRPGDTGGPGPGRAHGLVLEPSSTARPEPSAGDGIPLLAAPDETGRRGRWRAARPPRRGCLSAFLLFLLLSIPALGPQPAGRRGQASRAGAGGPFCICPEDGAMPRPCPGQWGRGAEGSKQQHSRSAQPADSPSALGGFHLFEKGSSGEAGCGFCHFRAF